MSESIDPSLLDALDDVFFTFDEDLTLEHWNRTLETVTGYDPETLETMSPTDFFADDAEPIAEAVATLLETGSVVVEADLRTADGETIPYEFSACRLGPADAAGFVGIGRDIGEQRRAEIRQAAALDRMSDGFFALDDEWRITYANEVGAGILSEAIGDTHSPSDLRGRTLWEAIPEAADTTFETKYREAVETQEPVAFEAYFEPLDIWFDVRAYPSETGLSVYFYDITDRHRQREAIERREASMREMYEIVADRRTTLEEQIEALLELGRRELEVDYGTLSRIEGEEYHFEIVSADDDAIADGDVVPVSATNCEIAASEERTLVLGDIARDAPEETDRAGYTEWGITCYVGAPVFVDGEVYGTFCFYDTEPRAEGFGEWEVTLVDLMSRWVGTELQRRRTTEELRKKNEKLERFASIVSHDLRNPLGVLEGWLELAEETGDPGQFARCHRAIDRMDALIEDLLVLARTGSVIGDPEPVTIRTVVEAAWQTVSTAESTLEIETDRRIRADETRLQQLFENLVGNSVEHGSTNSQRASRADNSVEHGSTGSRTESGNSVEHGGNGVTVTVGDLPTGFYFEDDGRGIPADEREDVFESGYSTADDGTGFGLSIVSEIVEAHGWELRLAESDAGGARFEITEVDIVE